MSWWVENTKGFVQLSYIEHFLILVTRTTGCISISDFASLFGVPVGITISKHDSTIIQQYDLCNNYRN